MSDRVRESFRDKRGVDSEGESDEDYYSEDVYSPWKKGNMENFMSNMGKNNGTLLIMAGAIICILIGLLIFVPMLRSPGDTKQIADMETRIKKLEDKTAALDQEYQKVSQIAISGDKVDQLSSRVDQLSDATNQRLDQLSRGLESRHKSAVVKSEGLSKPAAAPKRETAHKTVASTKSEPKHAAAAAHKPVEHKAPVKSVAVKEKEVHTSKTGSKPETHVAVKSPALPHVTETHAEATAKFHEVKPKETLYGIGHMYGVSVDELRKLNHMSPTDMPRIGQKLRVSP